MFEKRFCPILIIGFDPPDKGKPDNRLCTEQCAWFDEDNEQCVLHTIAEMESIINDNIPFDPYRDYEEFIKDEEEFFKKGGI